MAKRSAISIRLESDVLKWFRQRHPRGYQTQINSVLKEHVKAQEQRDLRMAGRAQELFRRFYAQCFWHYKADLEITPENIHLVAEGLKKYAGREGRKLAEELCH